jgi:uncharacterized protein YegL
MGKPLTEIVFLLDRSGSMHGVTESTIAGVNRFIDEQKNVEGDARFSLILFDDRYERIIDQVYIGAVEHLTPDQYWVRGLTALNDAICRAIIETEAAIRGRKDEFKPNKVLFVVLTDGLENASEKYTIKDVSKMIREKEENGWKFLFLGANIDAFAVGGQYAIKNSGIAQIDYASISNNTAFAGISIAVAEYRSTGTISDNWIAHIKTGVGVN